MSDDDNRDFLVNEVCKVKLLNDRYENIKCVNWPPKPGEDKRGCFSLVFKAFDSKAGKNVAIKFYDPFIPPDAYRMACFQREPDILNNLLGKRRCLQLIEGMSTHTVKVVVPGGLSIDLSCGFFVTDWVEYDIDDYFLGKEHNTAKAKLVLFRHIVSAVEAIHNCSVFHRDLKPDNMKADSIKPDDRMVLVIDFGTAARYVSSKLLKEYRPVGANAYSAPETFLGFAGEREIAKLTDIYALGCMLYELFNDSYFIQGLISNPNINIALTSLWLKLANYTAMEDKIKCFKREVVNFYKVVEPPDIASAASTLPSSISHIIKYLYEGLVKFDYNQRQSNYDLIRSRIDIAIKILDNEIHQKKVIERKKQYKANLADKLQRKEAKLNHYLQNIKRIPC